MEKVEKTKDFLSFKTAIEILDSLYKLSPELEGIALNLAIQRNINGITNAIKPLEPQTNELNKICADYRSELEELRKSLKLSEKSSEQEIAKFEEENFKLIEKHRESLDKFRKEKEDFDKFLENTDSEFKLKLITEDMIPDNISRADMSIIGKIIE